MSGRIAVATSGGRDSTALLHATARAARECSVEVHALHVHHGLVPQADGWVHHLRRQCARWSRAGTPVTLHVRRLQGQPGLGDSVEAWARHERYRVLSDMAQELGIDAVLLAHHQRDQAETLLLQALRGSGAAGLAAMPSATTRDGIRWYRPWLAMPRSAIDAYIRRYRLGFVEDASNGDARFARSRLRHSVWPALVGAFPDAEAVFAASCRRAHEAAVCAIELASIDGRACVDAQGHIRVPELWRLGAERRSNLLRTWLGEFLPRGVPDSLVQRLLRELDAARAAGRAVARWPTAEGWLRLYRGLLRRPSPDMPLARGSEMELDLSQIGIHVVRPWHGAFEVLPAAGCGIPVRLLLRARLQARGGGETFQRGARGVPRSLKKQFQSSGVPAWQRSTPLVYAGEQLLFVGGLGMDGRVCVTSDEPTLQLHWRPIDGA